MAKLFVVNEQRDTRVPFLRGMLTRSLQDAGLAFADAYQLATDIRDELDDAEVISTVDLRARIVDALREYHPGAVLRSYRNESPYRENIQVIYSDQHRAPFSRGLTAQRLQSCALPMTKCNAIARMIHGQLMRQPRPQITTDALTALTYHTIQQELGQEAADNYLIWNDFLDGDRPLIILLGGVACTGKSTLATELANSLGIVRTQSTDMLREVMRILIPERVSPPLHASSFNAGQVMERDEPYFIKEDEHLLYGFQRQSELVELACQAVLQRALNEGVSMILEGVHIRASLLARIADTDAIIVPFTLCVLDKNALISRIKGRKATTKQRRAARYLERIEEIWQLQSALLSETDRADIQILDNVDREQTVSEIIKTVTLTIAATYNEKQLKKLRATV